MMRFDRGVENVLHGVRALHVGGARERRRPHDVADGINVREGRLIVAVHRDVAARIRGEAHGLQPETIGVAGAPVRPEEHVRLDLAPRLEVQYDVALARLQVLNLLVVPNHAPLLAQVVRERFRDLIVQERQQAIVRVDEGDLRTEVDENGRILAPDHACALDRGGKRVLTVTEDRIAVAHAWMGKIELRRMIGARAGRDDDVLALDTYWIAGCRAHLQCVRIDEARLPSEDRNAIALVEAPTTCRLRLDDLVRGCTQLRITEAVRIPKLFQQRVAAQVMEDLDCVAQRFTRNRAPMRAAAADFEVAFDERDGAMILRLNHRGALACRPAADDNYVECLHLEVYLTR